MALEEETSHSPPPNPPLESSSSTSSKLNAQAPAFVPRTTTAAPSRVYHTRLHQIAAAQFIYAPPPPPLQSPPASPYYGGGFADRAAIEPSAEADEAKNETTQKIVNQVEFYFSDLNLATTDNLIRHMIKDPEGYVPISVVASFKKIKALIGGHAQLAEVLRNSTKLVVSEDGKKVKRQNPLTETDLEELQSRIVVADNLPEDHCHQNLMKIFSVVGRVKMIRTCHPQPSSGGTSSASRSAKSDSTSYINKLHAFVEYDSVELAEKAVLELNDVDNWRNGLKVRLLLRRGAKSGHTRGKKISHESELNVKDEDDFPSESNEKQDEDSLHHLDVQSNDITDHGNVGKKKGQNRGRGKVQGPGTGQTRGRGRGSNQSQQNNRGGRTVASSTNMSRASSGANGPLNTNGISVAGQPVVISDQSGGKQSSVPRMPDGTRGFSMGRGKPIAVRTE